ncbi:N-acetylglucosamine-6-phosphate deacetylase [Marinilactibacillus sp. Marseille-P9653]|uniref:N-acetylglucosamine-6-phosphate deacetylase n=1 Tax=Marinilactibacillus sp. Marseille-P9653 TaxID=2866583 RepID=UPI001CE3E043|nr:N-acetylglucosamine-6-phosphate deacetylase [Marinilactibacillus sp. Marseille-P9653]
MTTVYTHAQIYTGESLIEDGYIRFDQEIIGVGQMDAYEPQEDEKEIDMKNKLIVPGFIDVHSHGGYGTDNMDGTAEEISEMTKKMLSEGITSYFPTTMTQSDESIEAAMEQIKEAGEMNSMIQGIHLEGPFLSVEHKGAQPEKYIAVADKEKIEKWNELSGGLIKLVTYAPETGDVSDFEKYCEEQDIVLSAGHSDAKYQELKDSGATHVTHLFNGQRGLHHREVGVSGFGLLEDEVTVEMIVDGFHISPEMVKLAYKAKGADGIELITDAMRAKNAPEGESELGGQKVMVKDKQARLEDGTLAGSVLTFIDAFKNVIQFTGCSIEEAVKMSSVNQAKEFKLERKGALMPSNDADMLVLTEDLALVQTIVGGEIHDIS